MREYLEPETVNDYAWPEEMQKIIDEKRYKDTPFIVYKDFIGKKWKVFLMCDDWVHFYPCGAFWTKGDAIKTIESGKIFKDYRKDYECLGKLIELVDKYEKK